MLGMWGLAAVLLLMLNTETRRGPSTADATRQHPAVSCRPPAPAANGAGGTEEAAAQAAAPGKQPHPYSATHVRRLAGALHTMEHAHVCNPCAILFK